MRKMITMAVTAALAISTLTACGKTDKKETTASTAATTASTAATTASTEAKTEAKDTSAAAAESKADAQTPVSGSVATDGSTSMEKVIGALGEAFTKANPDATFTYNPTGAGSGIGREMAIYLDSISYELILVDKDSLSLEDLHLRQGTPCKGLRCSPWIYQDIHLLLSFPVPD